MTTFLSHLVVFCDSRTGEEFCTQVLKPLLENGKFDLIIIDPALAYLGGDANQQKDVYFFSPEARRCQQTPVDKNQGGQMKLNFSTLTGTDVRKPLRGFHADFIISERKPCTILHRPLRPVS